MLLPVQTPAWHVSVCVQALLSSQDVPFVTGVCTQPDVGLQLSAVHGLLSSQLRAALWHMPPEHVPACGWQMSGDGQAVPSSFWQLPVALQALHALQALVVQQKPFVQNAPLTHSSLIAQVAPSGFLPQVFPTHVLGATQSEFCVHVTRHDVEALHMNGEQLCVPPPTLQLPAPSQVFASACVDVFAGHEAATHCVPAGHLRHAPAPSHLPSLPQVEAAVTPHCPLGSATPAPMGEHVPSVALSTHDTHGPEQALSQHTPCAEQTRPEAHWVLAVQGPPLGSSPHEPARHVALGAHIALIVQVALQAPAPHE
jgi:hypothetical protein